MRNDAAAQSGDRDVTKHGIAGRDDDSQRNPPRNPGSDRLEQAEPLANDNDEENRARNESKDSERFRSARESAGLFVGRRFSTVAGARDCLPDTARVGYGGVESNQGLFGRKEHFDGLDAGNALNRLADMPGALSAVHAVDGNFDDAGGFAHGIIISEQEVEGLKALSGRTRFLALALAFGAVMLQKRIHFRAKQARHSETVNRTAPSRR